MKDRVNQAIKNLQAIANSDFGSLSPKQIDQLNRLVELSKQL